MIRFRRAYLEDLNAIFNIATHSGVGITSLPKDKKILKKRLLWSEESFNKNINKPQNEYYFFVLEDTEKATLVGTAGIISHVGYNTPSYSFKISKKTRFCPSLNIRNDYEILSIVSDNQGKSEISTLFLEPNYRHLHNGNLLSRARFLFMAHYPQRFSPNVIAQIRGVSDETGQSPFWNHLGEHFFHRTFIEVNHLAIATDKQFIHDLLPRNPIYISLLANDAQEVIAKPHTASVPAMRMLMREGFSFHNIVDIFDAGPTLENPFNQIYTLASSSLMVLKDFGENIKSKPFLIANTKLNFCAIVGYALFNEQDSTCTISQEAATLLQVKPGDCLRFANLEINADRFSIKD